MKRIIHGHGNIIRNIILQKSIVYKERVINKSEYILKRRNSKKKRARNMLVINIEINIKDIIITLKQTITETKMHVERKNKNKD